MPPHRGFHESERKREGRVVRKLSLSRDERQGAGKDHTRRALQQSLLDRTIPRKELVHMRRSPQIKRLGERLLRRQRTLQQRNEPRLIVNEHSGRPEDQPNRTTREIKAATVGSVNPSTTLSAESKLPK